MYLLNTLTFRSKKQRCQADADVKGRHELKTRAVLKKEARDAKLTPTFRLKKSKAFRLRVVFKLEFNSNYFEFHQARIGQLGSLVA